MLRLRRRANGASVYDVTGHMLKHDLRAMCPCIDDVQVRFFEESDDGLCWEAFGQFTPQQDVHHQVTLDFKW